MPGRYRQQEATEAWDQIMEFLDRVYSGHFAADAVHLRFEADFSADYDFSKSVRYGEELFPEPDMRRFSELKQNVAEGRSSKEELAAQVALYREYFALHPEQLA